MTHQNRRVVIAGACRTPIGLLGGSLSEVPAPELGRIVIAEAIQRAHIRPNDVDEVIMGNVLSAGVGQAPARQAALGAGLPETTPCLTINKMCGSGLHAAVLAMQSILSGTSELVVAGGMESMSNAPFLLPKARKGYRLGHGEVIDSLIKDGLWDVYNDFHMGNAAELCASKFNISREEQDAYACESYQRALAARDSGVVTSEIIEVVVPGRKGDITVREDERLSKVDLAKVSRLKPVFSEDGTVTAANASSINDGAAAVVLMSEARAAELGITPLAYIEGHAVAAKEPAWFTTAPCDAIEKLLKMWDVDLANIDLFEVNEAFAVVNLAAEQILGLQRDRVNVRGGAIALGHPIGASGARLLVTLLSALSERNLRTGLAALCIGGGEGIAMLVSRPD